MLLKYKLNKTSILLLGLLLAAGLSYWLVVGIIAPSLPPPPATNSNSNQVFDTPPPSSNLKLLTPQQKLAQPQQMVVSEAYGKLPMRFEANVGQAGTQAEYIVRGSGYNLFLTPNELVFSLSKGQPKAKPENLLLSPQVEPALDEPQKVSSFKMSWLGGNPNPKMQRGQALSGASNYFIGNDPAKWQTGVASYDKVVYQEAYNGIDLAVYGNQRELEYDWIIKAGADPNLIRLNFEGLQSLRITEQGALELKFEDGLITQHPPLIYQEREDSTHQTIEGSYRLLGSHEVGFTVGNYDHTRTLIIDPILVYSTFLGGNSVEVAQDIVVDNAGNAYVTGYTGSLNFPLQNPFQPTTTYAIKGFVTKLSPDGSELIYSTYLGGTIETRASSVAVDNSGCAYITGYTGPNFPLVNPFQPSPGGGRDAFVAKLSADGSSLVYSSYLGGSNNEWDENTKIVLDQQGNAYVAGGTSSSNFPLVNAYQTSLAGSDDIFLTKISSNGSQILYSTYLGGSYYEYGPGLAVGNNNEIYLSGTTNSADFPVLNAYQPIFGGGGTERDVFLVKFDLNLNQIIYSTFLGGNSVDIAYGNPKVDNQGNVYLAGLTLSENFPVVNAFDSTKNGTTTDGFVTKFNPNGTALIFSTYLGGASYDEIRDITINNLNEIYVIGLTASLDYPVVNPFQATYYEAGTLNIYISKFNASGNALTFSSYLGTAADSYLVNSLGLVLDANNDIYITGSTSSPDFLTQNPFQPIINPNDPSSNPDAFVRKLSLSQDRTASSTNLSSSSNPSNARQTITFTASITPISATGLVYFKEGASVLTSTYMTNGVATFATSNLTAGVHPISAVYNGNGLLTGSTSPVLTQSVIALSTSLALDVTPTFSNFGQTVVMTASVMPITATGTVRFYNDATLWGSASLSNGKAIFTTNNLNVGNRTLHAVYNGDAFYATSTSFDVNITIACNPLIITSSTDNGLGNCGTLSGALMAANQTTSPLTITLPAGTITVSEGGLPTINPSVNVIILGSHAVDANGRSMPNSIIIAGDPNIAIGMTLTNQMRLSGVKIVGFRDYQVHITGNNNTLTSSWLGTLDGVNVINGGGNNSNGIRIAGTSNQFGQIGSTQSGNLISGNGGTGVIVESTAKNNRSYYSWIGVQKDGVTPLRNGSGGVRIKAGGQLRMVTSNIVR